MHRVFLVTIGILAMLALPAHSGPSALMDGYRARCAGDTIYASCVDQRSVLQDGLKQAKAQGKRAVVIFGFNTCPPCNALDAWLAMPESAAMTKDYFLIEVSIFDPQENIRPEVFDTILPPLKLSINRTSPYGVPLVAIVDPASNRVIGQPVLGYNPAAIQSYLSDRR